MNYIVYLGVFLGIVLAFLFFWKALNVIQPNEIGVKIRLGEIIKRVNGLCFIWPYIEWIERYPRGVMTFSMKAPTIITSRGHCEGFEEEIEPTIMNVVGTVQAQFDDKDKFPKDIKDDNEEENDKGAPRIFRTIKYAPGYDAESLYEHVIPFVNDAIRAIGGRVPWRLLNQERYKFQLWVVSRMTCVDSGYYPLVGKGTKTDPVRFANIRVLPDGIKDKDYNADDVQREVDKLNNEVDKNDFRAMCERGSGLTRENLKVTSPYMKFGLRSITFTIDDINFDETEGMNKAITAPEMARLNKAADIKKSEGTKQVKINEGEGEATARQKMLDVIAKHPEFEGMQTLKEIGRGGSNFIYQLPEGLAGILGQKLFNFGKPKPNNQGKEADK